MEFIIKIARKLLIRTLDAFADRLSSMHEIFPTVLKKKKFLKTDEENYSQQIPELDGFIDIGYVQPIKTSNRPFEGSVDLLRGILYLDSKINQYD